MASLRVSTELDLSGLPRVAAKDLVVGELVVVRGRNLDVSQLRLVTDEGIAAFNGEVVANLSDKLPYYRRLPKGPNSYWRHCRLNPVNIAN
jgi:hypothetical protein